jgi:stage III sporulation protein AA
MEVWQFLPNPWRQALGALIGEKLGGVEEIRFRVGRPVYLYGSGWHQVLAHSAVPQIVGAGDMDRIVAALVDHSLYARIDELRQGFLTLPGGHRVGIAAHAVLQNGTLQAVRSITSLNLRVGRQVRGAAEAVLQRTGVLHGRSCLLVSPPRGGKTTLLRDLVRWCGDSGLRTVVVDERSEISGFGGTVEQGFDLGEHTDVLDGWPKPEGIEVAVRTLGPDIVAVDELGGEADVHAVLRARYAGVAVLATAHAHSASDLALRRHFGPLLDPSVFDAVVELSASPHPGAIRRIRAPDAVDLAQASR